jgi:lipoprotein-anchoring transpeptidase ErfK/SrfK
MPYCMFFNGNQGLHGSYNVVDGNASHGCVRMTVSDAEWVRFNFANIGTKVIVRPY